MAVVRKRMDGYELGQHVCGLEQLSKMVVTGLASCESTGSQMEVVSVVLDFL